MHKTAGRYRIANWNVERPQTGTEKTRLAMEKIAEINADLIVLTETSPAIDLEKDYPSCIKSEPYDENNVEHWVTIWSKWKPQERISITKSKVMFNRREIRNSFSISARICW